MPPQSPLTSTTRSALTDKLRTSVDQMISAGVPRDEIDSAVQRFKQKYLDVSQEDYEGPSWLRLAGQAIRRAPGAVVNTVVNTAKAAPQILGAINQEYREGDAFSRSSPGVAATRAVGRLLVAQPAAEQFNKSREAFSQGRVSEGLGHGAAAAIPVFGPMAAGAGENIGSGDPDRIAQGAVDLASLAAPIPVRGALRMRAARAPRAGAVPLTMGERAQGPIGRAMSGPVRFTERLAERTISGVGRFERLRAQQQAAIQNLADDAVRRISSRGGTSESVGRATQDALNASREAMRSSAREIYGQVDDLVNGSTRRVPRTQTRAETSPILDPSGRAISRQVTEPVLDARGRPTTQLQRRGALGVQTESVRKTAQELLDRIEGESSLIGSSELSRAQGILRSVIDSPDFIPFSDMASARTTLRQIAEGFDAQLPGKVGGIARRLESDVDSAMMTAAQRSGIDGLEEMVRQAQRTYKEMATTFQSRFIKGLVESNRPEAIGRVVRGASLDELRTLQRNVPPRVWDDVRASVLRDVFDEATGGEIARSGVFGQAADMFEKTGLSRNPYPEATMSGKRLQGILENKKTLGPEKLQVLFDKATLSDIGDIVTLSRRVGERASQSMAGLIAGGVNAAILSPIMMIFGGPSVSLAQSAGLGVGFNAVARLLTRQPVARARYLDMLKAMERGDMNNALRSGLAVSAMLGNEDGYDE